MTILRCKTSHKCKLCYQSFFREIHALKVMLVMTNYAKNYASKIYQTLVALREGYGYFLELHIARSFPCKIITQNEEKDFL